MPRWLSVGTTIILGITIVIPMCMIFFGAFYLNQCPQNEYIPVYLLIGGEFISYLIYSTLHNLLNIFNIKTVHSKFACYFCYLQSEKPRT